MEKSTSPFITLFTPCYNCSSTIMEVAECVNNQTYKDFEWIIYNDGSEDESEKVILDIISKYPHLNITFINLSENKGKHIAWNRAVEIARGELFICADADDTFEKDSLHFYYEKWQEVKNDPKCCGVLGLVDSIETGQLHSKNWPKDGWESNYLEFGFKYKINGETWGVTRTELLKQRLFPELYKGYWGEHYIWHWLALKGYYYTCYNQITRHYRTCSPGSIMDTQKKRELSPSQLQIKILDLLWQLKYTFTWHLRYKKTLLIKMLLFRFPKYTILYILKSTKKDCI